jgi:hypothetical protein
MPKVLDISGRRSGYLTAICCLSRDRGRWWLIGCDCGNELEMRVKRFTSGDFKSCGCMTSKMQSVASKGIPKPSLRTHGLAHHPAYFVWRSMKARCQLPTHQAWHNYGGRGITVCDRWQESFTNFWEDMGPTYQLGLTIERIDNMLGYSPENCTWETPKVQGRNKRTNHIIATPWGRMTVAEASERSGIGETTLLYRLDRTSDPSLIFSTPDLATDLSSRAAADH